MKRLIAFATGLALASAHLAAQDPAPNLKHRIETTGKKINADIASGALTKTDGDELRRELDRIKRIDAEGEQSGRLTRKTRVDIFRDFQKLQKDLARKELQAQALKASATPSP